MVSFVYFSTHKLYNIAVSEQLFTHSKYIQCIDTAHLFKDKLYIFFFF